MFKTLCASGVFTTSTVMVNNAVPPSQIGKVNGFAQSMASLARSAFPLLAGVLWSWSTHQTFDGSVFIAYYLAMIFYVATVFVAFSLHPCLDGPFSEASVVRRKMLW